MHNKTNIFLLSFVYGACLALIGFAPIAYAQDTGSFIQKIQHHAHDLEVKENAASDDEEQSEEVQQEGVQQKVEEEGVRPLPLKDRVMNDYPVVKLRSLDKVTARTMTFEAKVGSTVKFGSLYIKVQACRKAPPIEPPEAASFLQVWEVSHEKKAEWVFSGWMFASSPGLSAMDHPIYDVWVLDCLQDTDKPVIEKEELDTNEDGVLEEGAEPSQPDDMEEKAQ